MVLAAASLRQKNPAPASDWAKSKLGGSDVLLLNRVSIPLSRKDVPDSTVTQHIREVWGGYPTGVSSDDINRETKKEFIALKNRLQESASSRWKSEIVARARNNGVHKAGRNKDLVDMFEDLVRLLTIDPDLDIDNVVKCGSVVYPILNSNKEKTVKEIVEALTTEFGIRYRDNTAFGARDAVYQLVVKNSLQTIRKNFNKPTNKKLKDKRLYLNENQIDGSCELLGGRRVSSDIAFSYHNIGNLDKACSVLAGVKGKVDMVKRASERASTCGASRRPSVESAELPPRRAKNQRKTPSTSAFSSSSSNSSSSTKISLSSQHDDPDICCAASNASTICSDTSRHENLQAAPPTQEIIPPSSNDFSEFMPFTGDVGNTPRTFQMSDTTLPELISTEECIALIEQGNVGLVQRRVDQDKYTAIGNGDMHQKQNSQSRIFSSTTCPPPPQFQSSLFREQDSALFRCDSYINHHGGPGPSDKV
ncbi:expressed unknown protein [Seminavis robusta]|uniref:Uncharacterized protein n=1 Tax=Seminavis robusta TaxID=568900 RepID=A0A9N8E9N2_9STRA|nr:expressed unknown protein [Seminavis robusta]|eukprot:Sro780_g201482.1  (478) ;mRNA; f:33115-34615